MVVCGFLAMYSCFGTWSRWKVGISQGWCFTGRMWWGEERSEGVGKEKAGEGPLCIPRILTGRGGRQGRGGGGGDGQSDKDPVRSKWFLVLKEMTWKAGEGNRSVGRRNSELEWRCT